MNSINNNNVITYFDLLPDEVKVKVLSYTDAPSIINFYEAYPSFEYLSHDKEVISYVNFYKTFKFDDSFLHRFLTQKPRCDFIKVLNINCVYWLTVKRLRNCIRALHSLECLYAIDTKLSVGQDDCIIYSSLSKLKKLALSFVGKDFGLKSLTLFPNVRGLYLHLYGIDMTTFVYLKKLLTKMKTLEEIWLIDAEDNMQLSNLLYSLPSQINRAALVIYSCIVREKPKMIQTFESKRRATQFIFEKKENGEDIYGNWQITHPIWHALLNELHCEVPFGVRDARHLALKLQTLDDINFEELNFYHIDTICCIRLQKLINKALNLPNSKYLKKLSINFCICDETWRRDSNLEPRHKRQKNVRNPEGEEATLESIVKNCPHIEVLEVWGCNQSLSSSIPSLRHIKHLTKLKSLTLIDIPLLVDGSFLIDVCKSCSELQSLKVTPMKLNGKLNFNIREALKYAKNLRDFRFEHMCMGFPELMEPFIAHGKIERLFLKSTTAHDFTSSLFESFIKSNPQLVFVMIVIKEMSRVNLKAVQNTLNKYKSSPTQSFYCTHDQNLYSGRLPIPALHQYEIIKPETTVAVLDIFNGFT